jgi:hypothetical protein
MRWRAAVLAFLFISCATWTQTGRLVNDPCVHLGTRPASDGIGDYALTFQLSTDWPIPCRPTDGGVEKIHDD